MSYLRILVSVLAVLLSTATTSAIAHDQQGIRADSHAPIGVMGDHLHKSGEWMISLRHMQMDMKGNTLDGNAISDDEIVTTVPNPFSGMPGMPPTLRVVPQEMTMEMTMLGLMYAPSDRITLMAMLNFVSKDMTLTTYQGMMGTNTLGDFSTSTSGLADAKFSALVRLHESAIHNWHINLGVSLPVGSLDEQGEALTPMNMQMRMRLPYAMQLGKGTYNFEPGITYKGNNSGVSWGAQVGASIPLDENDEGYDWGNTEYLTAWLQYLLADPVSISFRYTKESQDSLNGRDQNIMAPVQTANPDNYGGERDWLSIGMNIVGQQGVLRGHRLAFEYAMPQSQNLNGLQMEADNMLVLGYQYAF